MAQRYEQLNWACHLKSIINDCGSSYLWESIAIDSENISQIRQVLQDQFVEEWSSTLDSTE